jgi:hypothetical protein
VLSRAFLFRGIFLEAFFENRDPADEHNHGAADQTGKEYGLDDLHDQNLNSHNGLFLLRCALRDLRIEHLWELSESYGLEKVLRSARKRVEF